MGVPAVHGESAQHQPIGLHIAMTAAAVMAGALSGPQAGIQGQLALANDPLTLHLAKMSRNQLTEIISELKVSSLGQFYTLLALIVFLYILHICFRDREWLHETRK